MGVGCTNRKQLRVFEKQTFCGDQHLKREIKYHQECKEVPIQVRFMAVSFIMNNKTFSDLFLVIYNVRENLFALV